MNFIGRRIILISPVFIVAESTIYCEGFLYS